MEKLNGTPIKLTEFLRNATPEERKLVANESKISVNYLWQIAGYHRAPSPILRTKITEAIFSINGILIDLSEPTLCKKIHFNLTPKK